MLGHKDGGVTLKYDIADSEEVNPITARVLDEPIGGLHYLDGVQGPNAVLPEPWSSATYWLTRAGGVHGPGTGAYRAVQIQSNDMNVTSPGHALIASKALANKTAAEQPILCRAGGT